MKANKAINSEAKSCTARASLCSFLPPVMAGVMVLTNIPNSLDFQRFKVFILDGVNNA
jgi:hypothetical protein